MNTCKVICYAVKNHGHAFGWYLSGSETLEVVLTAIAGAQTSLIQCLQYFEHLAEPIVDILALLKNQLDHTQLTEGILR